MSNYYAIKGETLSNIADALRAQFGDSYIEQVTAPAKYINLSQNYSASVTAGRFIYYNFPGAVKLYVYVKYQTSGEDAFVQIYPGNVTEYDDTVRKLFGGTYGSQERAHYVFEGVDTIGIYHKKSAAASGSGFQIYVTAVDEDGNFIANEPNRDMQLLHYVKFKPSEYAEKIAQMDAIPSEAYNITGNCEHRFACDNEVWLIEKCADKLTFTNITDADYMFAYSTMEELPIELNFNSTSSSANYMFYYCDKLKHAPKLVGEIREATCMFKGCDNLIDSPDIYFSTSSSVSKINIESLFSNCYKLEEVPYLYNLKVGNIDYLFYYCHNLREIPDDWCDTWDWTYVNSNTSSYGHTKSSMFSTCKSLRRFPMALLENAAKAVSGGYTYLQTSFFGCTALDELVNLPFPYTGPFTSNIFSTTFSHCARLKNMTFATPDGQPVVVNMKNQVLDLSTGLGYSITNDDSVMTGYNSGITADKRVKDAASYEALKNDPDWYTMDVKYARYNHDSAVATINSLPDTSAYLATAGGTNTIKFKTGAGELTDGGAIGTLTEEEIAVAAAKGWTVSLTA